MNVYLWNFTKKKKSTAKPLTTPSPVDIKLKDMVDIEHPSFTLTKATLGNNNYMKTTFYDGKERYYFLTDVEDSYFGQVIAHFEEDYLATWGCGQENGESVFASRCGSVLMERQFGQPRLKDDNRIFTGEVTNIKENLDSHLLNISEKNDFANRLFLVGFHCGELGLHNSLDPDTPDTSNYDDDLLLNDYYELTSTAYRPINAFVVRGNMAYYLMSGYYLQDFADDLLELAVKTNITSSKWESFIETVQMDVIATPFMVDEDENHNEIVGCPFDGSEPIKVYRRNVDVLIKQGVHLFDENLAQVKFTFNCFARIPADNVWTYANYRAYLVYNNGCDDNLCYSEFTIPMRNEGIINAGHGGTSYREYITFAPYSNFTLRVPMWGNIEIPMEKVYDSEPVDGDPYNYLNPSYQKRLKIRLCMDWISGNAFIGLYNTDDTFICGDIRQCCYRLPLQVNYDDTGLAHNILNLTTAGLSLITPLAGLANAVSVANSMPTPQIMTPPAGASKEMVARYERANKEDEPYRKAYTKAQEQVENEQSRLTNYMANIPSSLSGFLNTSAGNSGALVTQSDLDLDIDYHPYILIRRNEMLPILYDVVGVPVEKMITFYDVGQPSKAGFWTYKNYQPKKYGTMHERDMLKAICESGFWVEY